MAVRDERRTPREHFDNARTRYQESNAGGKWITLLIALAIIAAIFYMIASADGPNTANAPRTTPTTTNQPSNTTTTAPTTQPR